MKLIVLLEFVYSQINGKLPLTIFEIKTPLCRVIRLQIKLR